MTADDLRTVSVAFLALTATVAINLFAMQEKHGGSQIETSSLQARSFEATVAAALSSDSPNDLGPAAAPGANTLRLQPPKAGAEMPVNTAEIVRGIQRELNARGYEAGQPDGVAGLVTRAAIMAYEHDYGLPLTALPSQDLLSRIVLGSSAPAAQRGAPDKIGASEAEGVALMVEQQLAALGYTTGKADGKLNEQTARAIREFEVDQKLPESGRISGPLVGRLLRLQGQAVKAQPAKIKAAQK
jgi:peptidoglycan hydrolase-like protein with peptidoglycan-binding domain